MTEGDVIVTVKFTVNQIKFGDLAKNINDWNGIVTDMQVEK